MSVPQILAIYVLPRRDEQGQPLPGDGTGPKMPAPKDAHKYRCFLLGIRDPETVEELWREWKRTHAGDGTRKRKGRR